MAGRDLIDFQVSAFRGVASTVEIPLLGKAPVGIIRAGDGILCALEFNTEPAIATMKDITADISIARNGYIANGGSPTSNAYQGLLFWTRNQGPSEHMLDNLCLKIKLATGAGAATNIAVSGIELNDALLHVFQFTTAAAIASMKDITHLCTITAAGYIQCSASTASDQLLVFYHDVNGAGGLDAADLKFAVVDGTTADTNIAIAAIATGDVILSALHFTTKAAIATVDDMTSECVILTAGNIQFTDTDTSNDQHLIVYHNVA